MNHNLSTEEDVGALQIQNIVDAGSRTLGFVDSVDDQPRAVAVTLDRHFVPLAVVQRQGVDGDQALAAAEVESVPDEAKLCQSVSLLATFLMFYSDGKWLCLAAVAWTFHLTLLCRTSLLASRVASTMGSSNIIRPLTNFL